MNSLAIAQNDTSFETEGYIYANDPQSAAHTAAINQLRRFYPTVSHDVLGDDHISVLTLHRTMQYMFHLDQTFTMRDGAEGRTFDLEHFEKMKAEAVIWKEWQDSDEEAFPEALKYKPVVVAVEGDDEDEDGQTVITGDNETPVERKVKTPRSESSGSNYQLGKAIYEQDVANGVVRKVTLARMVKELGMAEATANVYYSKYKHE